MAPRGLITSTTKTKATGATAPKSTGGASSPVPIPGPGNLSYTVQPDGSIKLSDGRTVNWNTSLGGSGAPVPASQVPAGAQVREVPVISSSGTTPTPMYQVIGGTGYTTSTIPKPVSTTTTATTDTSGLDAWTKFLDDQRKKNEAFQLQLAGVQNAPSATDRLNQAQFEYEKQQNLINQQKAARGALQQGQNIQDLIARGSEDYAGLRALLDQQQKASEGQVQSQYDIALRDLNARRDLGTSLTTQGFQNVAQALQANQPQAFATAERAQAAQLTPTTVERYAQLTGIPTESIQKASVEAATGDQQAVNNYNRLLDFMQTQDVAAQQSRTLENQMAQAVATAQLQTIYGGATSGLEKEKLAALADVYNQIQAQRFNISQAELGRKQQLQDALNKVLGTGEITLDEPSGALEVITQLPEDIKKEVVKPVTATTKPADKGKPATTATKPATTTTTTKPTPPAGPSAAQIAAQQKAENEARARALKAQQDAAAAAAKAKAVAAEAARDAAKAKAAVPPPKPAAAVTPKAAAAKANAATKNNKR